MSGKLTAAQRAQVHRKAKPKEIDPADEGGELNIVPFLDIVTNVLMFLLATITTVFTATIPVPAPNNNPGPSTGTPPPQFTITVKIVAEGYIVGAPGGFLQPGCTQVSDASLTVPLLAGRHDADGLTRCMQAIRNNPSWQEQLERRKINIAVNEDVRYEALVRTLDAVRGTRPGLTDMFAEPTLGILR